MKNVVQINQGSSYKIGMDEIVGLEAAMREILEPVRLAIKKRVYWGEVLVENTEYKSRDGFIPHSHNAGGLQIVEVIPKCEEYEFGYLEFGSYEYDKNLTQEENEENENSENDEGYNDAKLRIWFKFEGYDRETGDLNFWLYMGGGNGDAPYFRSYAENDIFDASFSCKSVKGLKRAAYKHVNKLLKIVK